MRTGGTTTPTAASASATTAFRIVCDNFNAVDEHRQVSMTLETAKATATRRREEEQEEERRSLGHSRRQRRQEQEERRGRRRRQGRRHGERGGRRQEERPSPAPPGLFSVAATALLLLWSRPAINNTASCFTVSVPITKTRNGIGTGHNNNGLRNIAATTTTKTRPTEETTGRLFIRPPPGWGYLGVEDEVDVLPPTYEPMMEYPGTMRPGRTPENMPYQDLPIGDDDPDPIPWPHFQQIEWHHRWEPPHDPPIPMERFIEMHGRWATPEMEAAMRAGTRRDVRERREREEAERSGTVITDDDDDDDVDDDFYAKSEEPVSLGDGVFGKLGSAADQAATAAATSPEGRKAAAAAAAAAAATSAGRDDEDIEEEDDGGLDDFLLDLGLDVDLDEGGGDETDAGKTKMDDDDENNGGRKKTTAGDLVTASINVDAVDDEDEDDVIVDIDLGLDDDVGVIGDDDEDDDDGDTLGGGVTGGGDSVPLEDFSPDEEGLDAEDIFDEGGFDFDDDGGGGDGGDFDGW